MSVMVLMVVKVTVILCVALAATRIAARACAAIRHTMLAVAFAGLLMLPFAMWLLPVSVPLSATTIVKTILPDALESAVQSLPMSPATAPAANRHSFQLASDISRHATPRSAS